MIIEAMTKFSVRNGLTAFEWLQMTLLFIWGLIIWDAHRNNAPRVGLYGELEELAPWWFWVGMSHVIIFLILAGASRYRKNKTQYRTLLYVSIVGKMIYWATMSALTFRVSSTYLVPSLIFAFALTAAFRYGELRYEARR